MPEFTVGGDSFLLDGRPVRLLSGAMHYFRVHEAQWGHRLAMLRAMGLNCVEAYVPWNLHEPHPGRYEDVAAAGRFIDAAQAAGLWVIVRPGPYICAEWENGGLPHWLTGPLGPRVRTRDPEFLAAVDDWFDAALPQVVARQVTRGGPVLMVQVENEYGSYGSDRAYLRHLADGLRARGVTVPLYTADGPEDHMLTAGTLPGVPAALTFGSGAREAFATLRRHRPDGPLMCAEFWCGWFDHWGEEHVVREPADAVAALAEILGCGASVNFYMAHGGTSFGGWAGANRAGELHRGALQPDVTSYDYGAPVDGYVPAARVLAALGGPETESGVPPTFEELDVDRGLVRYRFRVPGPRRPYPLLVTGLRDVAVAYVRDAAGERRIALAGEEAPLGDVAGPAEVEVWVESLGRVNYGPRLGEPKGITGGLLHERQYVHGVRARGLRLDALDDAEAVAALPYDPPDTAAADGPDGTDRTDRTDGAGLYRASAEVARPGDAALELPGWGRGWAWVNGFCLGRYWAAGPQEKLYVPGPVLRTGTNEVLLLELTAPGTEPLLTPPPP
ncbi:glycoside hydrolase family 35 protein [Streptomyces phytophilus]|uniref:glycoside hydrolase family 35 protein n=1 Tax=Streptomyces phytophilus TaxID=722715 RepID=UPI0015F111D8|nr:beta-galactosidase family protein [Streptomyces phytophilus]